MKESNDGVDELLAFLQKSPNDSSSIRTLLRTLRVSKLRRSDAVVLYGHKLLKKFASSLQDAERK